MASLWRVRWNRQAAVSLLAGLLAVLAGPMTALAASQGQGQASPPANSGAKQTAPPAWQRGLPEQLRLTDQQRQEIRRIQLQAQEQLLPVTTELFRKRQELALALRQPQLDEARIRNLVQEVGRLRTEVETARMETRLKVLSVLTPEQRERVQALWLRGGWGGPRGGRAGHGACGGPGPRRG